MKILSALIYLLRELIFDYEEEYNFRSPKFNSKKVITFFLILGSLILNVLLINKVYVLAKQNSELRQKFEIAAVKNDTVASSDSKGPATITKESK